jgi:hypothetical protein
VGGGGGGGGGLRSLQGCGFGGSLGVREGFGGVVSGEANREPPVGGGVLEDGLHRVEIVRAVPEDEQTLAFKTWA